MSELVSIVIPVYNAEKYIKTCIESIFIQDYKNFEIIAIDDGSNDSSYKILKGLQKKDSRLKIFHQQNSGVSKTRNYGINKSNGKYLTFIDADDVIDKRFLSIMMDNINNSELIQATYVKFYDKINTKNISKVNVSYDSDIYNNQLSLIHKYCPQKTVTINIWGKIYILDIIKKNKIYFDENLHMYEDGIFNLKYLNCCKKITYIDNELYYYRVGNGQSLTKKMDTEKNIQNKYCITILKKFFEEKKVEYRFNDYFNLFCYNSILSYFDSYLFHKNNKLKLKEKKNLFKKIYNDDDYLYSIKNVCFKKMSMKEKILYFPIKVKSYEFVALIYILIYLKNIIKTKNYKCGVV